jgi:proteasome regulatory subunit
MLQTGRDRGDIQDTHAKDEIEKFDVSRIIKKMDGFTGADIKAVCTEAGYVAIREDRKVVTENDFESAVKKIRKDEDSEHHKMFG